MIRAIASAAGLPGKRFSGLAGPFSFRLKPIAAFAYSTQKPTYHASLTPPPVTEPRKCQITQDQPTSRNRFDSVGRVEVSKIL